MAFVPPIPAGMSLPEFSHRLWGIGLEDAEERLKTITRAEIVELGMNIELTQWWLEFYKSESMRERGLPTSAARVKLLERCYQLLTTSDHNVENLE